VRGVLGEVIYWGTISTFFQGFSLVGEHGYAKKRKIPDTRRGNPGRQGMWAVWINN
jgi:hypothetical protein